MRTAACYSASVQHQLLTVDLITEIISALSQLVKAFLAVLLSSYHGAYRQTAPAEVSGAVQRDMRCSKNIIAFGVFFKCRKYKEEADQRASLLIPLFLTVGSLQVLQEEHKKRTGPYWCFQKVLSDCSDSWFKVLLTRNDACVFNSTKMIFFFPSIFFFHKFF